MAAHFVRWQWSQRCFLSSWELFRSRVTLLSERRSEFRQIRARAIHRAPAVPQSTTSTELSGVRCSLATRSKTVYEHIGPQSGLLRAASIRAPIATLHQRHSTDASHKHTLTARIDASSIASRSDAIAEALPRGIGEEKARGRGRLWRGRAVDAEDEEEEGASAASYAVDASSPLTRRCPRRKRRRMTSPAWRAPGTPPTRAKKRGRRSVEARKSGSAAPAPPLSQAVA